jgi:hypothetical protein
VTILSSPRTRKPSSSRPIAISSHTCFYLFSYLSRDHFSFNISKETNVNKN